MGSRTQPLLSYRYRVEIMGLIVAGFSEVSGLEQEIEIEEYKEGGMDFVHKFPSGIKQRLIGNLTGRNRFICFNQHQFIFLLLNL